MFRIKDDKLKMKYKNKPCTWKGIQFDSQLEYYHALWLESEKQAGRIRKWVREKEFKIKVKGYLICKMYPDFYVVYPDGYKEVHECKSKPTRTSTWLLKYKLFKAIYGHKIGYRIIEKGKPI